MDIAGAEALRKRLGSKVADEAPSASADVHEDAPPVYHWLGVSSASVAGSEVDEEEPAAGGASFFRRLGLSFR